MKKKFPYPIAILIGCIILIQPSILDSLVAFWLTGLIPGTTFAAPSPIMLAIMFIGIWLVLYRFILPDTTSLRAYIHKKKQKLSQARP